VSFPVEDSASPLVTRRRENKSLEQVWSIIVNGRQSHGTVPRQEFQRLLAQGMGFTAIVVMSGIQDGWLMSIATFGDRSTCR
jgi:hypothetical protein